MSLDHQVPVAARVLRRVLPRAFYQFLRSIVATLVTPTAYAAQHGYYASVFRRSVVGVGGEAAPWLTFPLVTFLDTRSFADRSILEFGSGQSSLWWASRAKHVLALETDPAWTERVRASAPANLEVRNVPLEYASAAEFAGDVHDLVGSERFDVVVVDGGDRVKALLAAPDLVAADGVIVSDDLDLFRSDPEWSAAIEALRDAGFGSVDFFGLAVGAPFTRRRRCSTLFFRDGSFITR